MTQMLKSLNRGSVFRERWYDFVGHNSAALSLIVSRFDIKMLAHLFIGNETAATAVCTNRSHQPRVSSRPKRKLVSSPGFASSVTEDGNEEKPERKRKNIKRVRKAVERDEASAVDAAPLPSKGMNTNPLGLLSRVKFK